MSRVCWLAVLLACWTGTLQAQAVHLRLHVIRLADSDGSRAAAITPGQMLEWVSEANAALARSNAGIKLHFVATADGPDWEVMQNTALNRLASHGPGWGAANVIASQHYGKVVVFVRHGGADSATGNGFAFPPQSGKSVNFIALPGFSKTSIPMDAFTGPWVQNRWVFGHELGHYLGLGHTFPGWNDLDTDTHAKASAYIAAHGGSASALDGDSIPDTPPEAGTQYYRTHGWKMCSGPSSYAVVSSGSKQSSLTFAPMRSNMMSYFVCGAPRFTPGQVARIRQTLKLPGRSSVALSQAPSLDVVTTPAPKMRAAPPRTVIPDIKARDQSQVPPTATSRPAPRLRVPPPPPDSTRTPKPSPRDRSPG